MNEAQTQQAILAALAGRRDLRIWRNNSGVAVNQATNQGVRFGVKGQADLSGLLQGGRRLEIEVKSATGRQTPEQKDFQAMIERFGGVYILARTVEDALLGIDAAQAQREAR